VDVLLNWIWQGSVIAAVTAIMLVAIERSRARDRYLTVWAALLSVLALPIVAALGAVSSVPASAVALPEMTPGITGSSTAGATVGGPLLSVPAVWWTSNVTIAALWLLWSSIAAARLAFAAQSLRRIKRASTRMAPARQVRLPHWASVMWRGRRAELTVSDAVRSAAVLGCGSPTIALAPALLDQLDDNELDHIVIHEWAHVQRRDDLVHVLLSCIRVVAGWHPAVWWLDRQLGIEREIACDEMAVAVTGSAKGYAASLVKLASLPALRMVPQAALPAIGPVNLRRRIVRILSRDHRATATPWRLAAAGSSASLCVLAIMLGDVRAIEAAVEANVEREVETAVIDARRSVDMSVPPPSPIAGSDLASTPPLGAPLGARADARTQDGTRATADVVAAPMAAQRLSSRPADAAPEPQPAMIPASHISGALSVATPRALTSAGTATAAVPTVPWRELAARSAAAGVAVGRESHDAAVASAGYFTRLGKRIASSF
jgi:beta-lactamase regulating signal transducer with metallopeptidase domain